MSAKVLVVDDSRTIRTQIGLLLGQAGYQVVEAEDGLEGLSAIGLHRDIAMVICDVNMPNMDGLEMLAALKSQRENSALPVFMLTTEGQSELIAKAKRCGAKGWIVKPFKPEQLVAVVKKTVGS
jgi:two-component system, chemotaxis family, chemotaxis protein CheY